MKKLGIFLSNNQNEYIKFLLDSITPNLSHFCVIINNKFEANNIFEKYTEDIIINSSYQDIDIWSDVLINHIGFDTLVNFDEIILFDDSFFGPIYSFEEIFNNMDNINLDFWTILSNGVDDELNSTNIQFIAFRNNLIKSDDFKEFWRNANCNSLKDKNNENYLINYFSDLKFKWKNYLDVANNFELDKKESFFCIFDVYNLIINYKLPLINIKPFTLPKKIHLKYHNGLDLSLTMNYLNHKTDYDVSLIYKYLLKIMDPNALVNLLNLNKIIPRNSNTDYRSDKAIAVIVHIYYEDLLDYDFKLLRNIPEYIDIIITTNELDKKVLIEKNFLSKLKNNSKVILVNSRGREMSALFVGCKDIIKNYDYFCFVHDKKSSFHTHSLIGSSFRDTIWENMLASEDYINSIIKYFDENDSLGVLVPPRVNHATIFTSFYANYWLSNVNEMKKLLDKMNINVELNLRERPLSIGNCYWARFEALKPLFNLDFDYVDFNPEPMPLDGTVSHALERIYGHVAASQGFYTEIVMTEDYGSNEITNYSYMFSEVLMIIRNRFDKKLVKFVPFSEFLNMLYNNIENLDNTIRKKDKKINEITNSNSWKITKPLRMFTLKLKNFKSKLIK